MGFDANTVQTYDRAAEALAKDMGGIGSRTEDIERALRLAGANDGARVVEIGCGDGRDAAEIVRRVAWYEGFDPSEGLLRIARRNLPQASFVRADALGYQYPRNLDVVYAFASLLHVPKADMPAVFQKVLQALRPGGILYLSLKERDTYFERFKQDEYGERMFYYYNAPLIKTFAGDAFTIVHEAHKTIGKNDWCTLGLKKN